MKALTTKSIMKLKRGHRYRDRECKGLYIQVSPSGSKSWLLRFELNHKERYMGLGEYPLFSLKAAREKAQAARRLLAEGVDPIANRAEVRKALAEQAHKAAGIPTFRAATERYFKVHGDKWRNYKHRRQFMRTLEDYAYPTLGNLRVDEIDKHHVLKCIEPIWREKCTTASRVRGRIESVLSWAIANGYRENNPARWSDNLEHLLVAPSLINKVVHYKALPYAELPAFWPELTQREGIAARALEFTVLTAARTGEVIGARWDEINIVEKTWTVPANRIKGGKEHRVPLSDRTLALLKALPQEPGNPLVFIGTNGGGLSNTAMFALLARMGRTGVTVHGFRSSFKDWASERTNYPTHIVEMCLAHTVGSAVERSYRRTDLLVKRSKLMSDWAKFCVTPVVADNVVAITSKINSGI